MARSSSWTKSRWERRSRIAAKSEIGRHHAALLIAGISAAVWLGALWVPFHFDDWPNIVLDSATANASVFAGRMSEGVRPLLRASWFLDHAVGGMQPFVFHLTNLLLHVATTVGVFALASRRLDLLGAFLAALVFTLQPANVETVAYVTGRSSGLSTFFIVAALLAREHRFRLVEAAAFVCAVLSRETAIIYLVLAWFWDASKPAPSMLAPAEAKVSSAWSSMALAAGAAVATFVVASLPRYRHLLDYSTHLRGPIASLAVNARAVPEMLSLWVRPWSLSIDHRFDASPHLWASAGGALLLLVAVKLGALAWRRARHPGAVERPAAATLALAIGWPLLALLPSNSIIAKRDPVTERPLYLAWIGVSILAGFLLARFLRGTRPRLRVAVAALLLAAMAAATVARLSVWRDPRRLWLDAVTKAPEKARAWNNLGMAFETAKPRSGRNRMTAIAAFRHAVVLDPSDHVALGNLQRLQMSLPPDDRE